MKQNIDDLHIFTLHAGYAEHYSDWNWKNVRSPFARLYYVTEGAAQIIIHKTETNDLETVVLKPNHMYLIPPFTLHSNVCDGNFKHYYIHVIENTSDRFHYLSEFVFPREIPSEDVSDLSLFQTLAKINRILTLSESDPESYNNDKLLKQNVDLGKQRPLCDKVESRGILYIILSRFLKLAKPAKTVKDERIIRVIEYMNANIARTANIEELAQCANLSKDHFIRRFRKETGTTPLTYFTARKIEVAESMLIATDLPIKSIADKLGFEDTSYFYRLFKKHVGKSPKKYRESSY